MIDQLDRHAVAIDAALRSRFDDSIVKDAAGRGNRVLITVCRDVLTIPDIETINRLLDVNTPRLLDTYLVLFAPASAGGQPPIVGAPQTKFKPGDRVTVDGKRPHLVGIVQSVDADAGTVTVTRPAPDGGNMTHEVKAAKVHHEKKPYSLPTLTPLATVGGGGGGGEEDHTYDELDRVDDDGEAAAASYPGDYNRDNFSPDTHPNWKPYDYLIDEEE